MNYSRNSEWTGTYKGRKRQYSSSERFQFYVKFIKNSQMRFNMHINAYNMAEVMK